MASHDDLLELLRGLETELHQPATRRDPERLGALLHPEFREFGRSGRSYSRSDTLQEFTDASTFQNVVAGRFRLQSVTGDAALLTYVSAHSDEAGGLHRFTLRSSLWVRDATGWRLIFHQGTAADGETGGELTGA